jgi:hypothetical protein
MGSSAGVFFLIAGAVLALIGLLALSGSMSWFGRLPGDIRWSGGNVRFFMPVVSMVIVSVVLTVLLNVVGRLR